MQYADLIHHGICYCHPIILDSCKDLFTTPLHQKKTMLNYCKKNSYLRLFILNC